MTQPVTVSITRQVDPTQEDQMRAWRRAGSELAERFEGFLGSGWVRSAPNSSEWLVLYRFASPWVTTLLHRWLNPPPRS